jgi:hypothetical protein
VQRALAAIGASAPIFLSAALSLSRDKAEQAKPACFVRSRPEVEGNIAQT